MSTVADARAAFGVLHLDNHLLVVDKPAGLLAQPDASGDPDLVTLARAWIAERFAKPGRVYATAVHRLDRGVAGVVVIARTSKAAGRLSAQFRERTVEKTYRAVVEGALVPAEGELTGALVREWSSEAGVVARVVEDHEDDARDVRLAYRTLATASGRSLVEIALGTGRSHQIRAQLAHAGCPIVGDVKYGARSRGPLALFAWRVAFDHPTRGERVAFEAHEPEDWPWPPR